MLQIDIYEYPLQFKFKAGTSRGVLTEKMSWLLKVYESDNPNVVGWGEVNIIPHLSMDDVPDIESHLIFYCKHFAENPILSIEQAIPPQFPALRFGLETALFDLQSGGEKNLFGTSFMNGENPIPINGLVWMGDISFMQEQLAQKIEEGYNCIKIKIGAIDFEQECKLISSIRNQFNKSEMMIRLDANGAFAFEDAETKLNQLAAFDIHSIEQPIKAGQIESMKTLCSRSPIPIALDEELIGVYTEEEKFQLLKFIQPQYIILKPALLGGMMLTHRWITMAEELGIAWWITSALESNIGLNAIAQFTAYLKPQNHQGLGTGQLYVNNISSPLEIKKGHLYNNPTTNWVMPSNLTLISHT
jgi:O-succinylbenzoate synthase